MNAADRIQQAIQKLESQKAAILPGPWRVYETMMADVFIIDDRGFLRDGVVCGPTYEKSNAELIVTLHHTIEPQLAILRSGWEAVAGVQPMPVVGANFANWYGSRAKQALDLANAIIGEDA